MTCADLAGVQQAFSPEHPVSAGSAGVNLAIAASMLASQEA